LDLASMNLMMLLISSKNKFNHANQSLNHMKTNQLQYNKFHINNNYQSIFTNSYYIPMLLIKKWVNSIILQEKLEKYHNQYLPFLALNNLMGTEWTKKQKN
jgi:hypothetical protein